MEETKFKDEVLSEEQLEEVSGGVVKEALTMALNVAKGIQATINSPEYQMLNDSQKNIAFMMAVENTALGALSSVPGLGDAFKAINSLSEDMSPKARLVAEDALNVIVTLGDKYLSELPI